MKDSNESTTEQWLKKAELSLREDEVLDAAEYLVLAEEKADAEGEDDIAELCADAQGHLVAYGGGNCEEIIEEAQEML